LVFGGPHIGCNFTFGGPSEIWAGGHEPVLSMDVAGSLLNIRNIAKITKQYGVPGQTIHLYKLVSPNHCKGSIQFRPSSVWYATEITIVPIGHLSTPSTLAAPWE